MSTYTAKITWKSDSQETFTKDRYSRGHEWEFDGDIEHVREIIAFPAMLYRVIL